MNINPMLSSQPALTQSSLLAANLPSMPSAAQPDASAAVADQLASVLATSAVSGSSAVAGIASSVPSLEELQKIAEQIRQALPSASYYGLDFSVDRAAGMLVIRVVEQGSGKLIRQIPSDEALQIAQAIDRQLRLLQQKA